MMRRTDRSRDASMRTSQVILQGDWPVSSMNAPSYSAHWAYIDTMNAAEQWVNVSEHPAINFGGKVACSPHAINDTPAKAHLWLDVWIYNPDGTLLIHKVTDQIVPPGGEIFLETVANGAQIGAYSAHAEVAINV